MDRRLGRSQSEIGNRPPFSRLPTAGALWACRLPNRRGFTLIEVLVALVIFGIITVALSFTFDTALKTQVANTRRLEELGAVRSVFDYMTRDIQQAYASSTNPAAVFIASSGQSGGQGASNGLLTLMTRGNRLVSDATTGTSSGPAAVDSSLPQSETAMVRYDFDPQARTLSRTVVGVPSLQAIQQATTGSDSVMSGLIYDVVLRFWDPTMQSWRNDWDYEQQNQQAAAATSASPTGAATDPTAAATSATSSDTGDTTLPGSVEVTLTIRHADSTTATYVTTIPLVTSQVADGKAPPVNTGTATSTTGAAQ